METVRRVLKRSGFKKASPETKVTTLLSQLRSTHDAIFIFKGKGFLGAVNLYHSFLGKRVNPQEKAGECLYHPPVLSLTDSVVEAARLMVESRLYRLPVLKGERFLGVVFAEDILRWAGNKGWLNDSIKESLRPREIFLISKRSSISQAIHLMIKKRTNRLLVTDGGEKILGLISLYDLRRFFTKPNERISFLMRAPIKKEFAHQPVVGFYRRPVVSLLESEPVFKGADLMIKKGIGSLVVFPDSRGGRPLGLISLRDLLRLVAGWEKKEKQVSLARGFNKQKLKLAKKTVLKKIRGILASPLFSSRVKRVDLNLREIAKGGREVRLPLMEVTALVRLKKGNQLLRAKARGRRLTFITDEIIDKLKTMIKKRKERRS